MGLKTQWIKLQTALKKQCLRDIEGDPNAPIVCLTSIPTRFHLLHYPIISLLHNTIKPRHIELNIGLLANGKKPELPAWLQQLSSVKIYYVNDMGPMTKFMPSIERHYDVNTPLIIVDDDTYFHKQFISTLIHYATQQPDAAICYRGQPLHHSLIWDRAKEQRFNDMALHRVAIVMGCAGYLLKPQFIKLDNAHNNQALSPIARKMDDIWISGLLSQNHIAKYEIGLKKPLSKLMEFDSAIVNESALRIKYNSEAIAFFKDSWLPEELS